MIFLVLLLFFSNLDENFSIFSSLVVVRHPKRDKNIKVYNYSVISS